MKKLTAFIFAVIVSCVCVFAQSSVWEISKNGNTIYLGGSVHLLRSEDFPLPKEFDTTFDKSEILVLEANVGQMDSPEVIQKLMGQAMLPGDATLQTVLNTETYKLLESKCAELNIPIAALLKMKPGMAATTLSTMKLLQIGFTPQGVDTYYFAQASKKGKQSEFLETIDFQINLIVNIGEGYENEFVVYTLSDLDNIEKEMNALVPEWRNGASSYVDTEFSKMKKEFPSVYKIMLSDRNQAWLPIIETYLKNKKAAFVIVGLAHLHGKDGLLALLQKKGYTVKQVK